MRAINFAFNIIFLDATSYDFFSVVTIP